MIRPGHFEAFSKIDRAGESLYHLTADQFIEKDKFVFDELFPCDFETTGLFQVLEFLIQITQPDIIPYEPQCVSL
jgi:hypothetical protein